VKKGVPVTGMDLKLSSCTVLVHDPGKALAFYRDVLGFEVRSDTEFESMRWVSIGPPSQPGLDIVLMPPGADQWASPADKQALADLMAKGLLGRLAFATDDCDQTFERIEAAGAEVMQEPIDQSCGVRDCAFLDPSGNMLRFAQALNRIPVPGLRSGQAPGRWRNGWMPLR